ncbi:MAG: translation initiation factor 2 [Micromonosporaceae bacterium]
MDDAYWRRSGEAGADPQAASSPAAGPHYAGPPAMVSPPAGWRPPHHVEPAPPRPLPAQDHERIDADEAQARTVTQGVALLAAAVMIVLTCLLCGRALF